jgi:predicted GH43/DUF377 family glycosyl hydrolase
MIAVKKHGILLSPTDHEFENNGVFNPGIFQIDNKVHILYRAVQNGNFSTIGYAKTEGPLQLIERHQKPLLIPEFDYEKQGIEDPRIVKIDRTYYITYTAYDGINAMGAVATSKDLISFEKLGIVTPRINYRQYAKLVKCCNHSMNPKYHHFYQLFEQIGLAGEEFRYLRDKDLVLFPRKINGKFALLHRIWPGIQIAYFEDWKELTRSFWEDYIKNLSEYIVLDPKDAFEMNYIGAGGPPIETEEGWLLIYHGVQETTRGRTYHAKAALLDRDNPQIEISRLPRPLFSPSEKWEKEGVVNNVVFPTGHAVFEGELYLYYGASDKYTGVVSTSLKELLHFLKKQS